MKRVEVLIPFHNSETKVDQVSGDIIEVSDERLAEIRKVNVNMVLVLEEVKKTVTKVKTKETEEPKEVKKPKRTKKTTE